MKTFLVGVLSLFYACGSSSYFSLTDYIQQKRDDKNKFAHAVSFQGIYIISEYLPPQAMALREAGSLEALRENYQNLLRNYEGAEFFELRFNYPETSTRKILQQRFTAEDSSESAFEQYIDFSIQNDLKLIVASDTFPCAYLHREISESITNELNYTISFEPIVDSLRFLSWDQTIAIQCQLIGLNNIQINIPRNQISLLNSLKP